MPLLPLQPTQARSPLGLVAPLLPAPSLLLSPKYHTGFCFCDTTPQSHTLAREKEKVCPQQTPAQTPALKNGHLSSFTYLPNNFLIPLAFFLESGEGGAICRLSASFGRGGKPARSKWSADPFSVSAVRKQKLCQDPLVLHCTDMLLTLGMTPAKLLTVTMSRK